VTSLKHGAQGSGDDDRAGKLRDIRTIARRLGVCDKTVRRLIARGELHAYRVGRQIRISDQDYDSYLEGYK
jgi:excisionase family DNA binding protein